MIKKIKRKNISKQEKIAPSNIEELIQMYKLDEIWTYIEKIIDIINKEA